jgi:hypothetical protein
VTAIGSWTLEGQAASAQMPYPSRAIHLPRATRALFCQHALAG